MRDDRCESCGVDHNLAAPCRISKLEVDNARLVEQAQMLSALAATAGLDNARLERELAEARAWIVATPCRCKPGHVIEQCPTCNAPIHKVRNDSPCLNDEQFASIRAGDYYCKQCTSNQARSGYQYYWERDLPRKFVIKCERCDFLDRAQATTEAK